MPTRSAGVTPAPALLRPVILVAVGGNEATSADQFPALASIPVRSEIAPNSRGAEPVAVTQARLMIWQVGPGGESELPEVLSAVLATQVAAATLDGDDSVRLVEALLERNTRTVEAGVRTSPGAAAPRPAPLPVTPPAPMSPAPPAAPGDAELQGIDPGQAAAPAEKPVAPAADGDRAARLAPWLAAPVAVAAAGWLWWRAHCAHARRRPEAA
jgi:hypothetical protein